MCIIHTMDTYTEARKSALYDLYCNNKSGGLLRIGRGAIELLVTITSPISTQITARHYNEIGKYVCLQWMEVRNPNGVEKITGFKEVFK